MGREGGTAGSFVMPAARSYAYTPPASVAGPVAAVDAWLDDLERQVGFEVRGKVKLWVAGGLDEKKLKSAIRSAVDPRLVFERLRDAKKGIYQQRVVIDDYESIPGVVKGDYVNNSLPEIEILASTFGVDDPRFNLPPAKATTFTEHAVLKEVKPGEKLYRVTSDPTNDPRAKTGGFWTRTLPTQLADVIGGTAVMPEWNNFQRVYEFTAPPYNDPANREPKFYVWEGPTAAQPVSNDYIEKKYTGYHLPGGEPQSFINNHLAWDADFPRHIVDITPSHKPW